MNQTDAAPPELLPTHTVFIDSDWLTVGKRSPAPHMRTIRPPYIGQL
jgi:hypothetical protein